VNVQGYLRKSLTPVVLAPIYGWFTEGFATPDLIAAKALIDELAITAAI
jgi:hypothetical protein